MAALRQKKAHEDELLRLSGTRATLETQVNAIESANLNAETMLAMKKGAEALKGIHSNLCVPHSSFLPATALVAAGPVTIEKLEYFGGSLSYMLALEIELMQQQSRQGRPDHGLYSRTNGPYKRDFRGDFEPCRYGQHGGRGELHHGYPEVLPLATMKIRGRKSANE